MNATAFAERYASASPQTREQVDRLLEQDADDKAWADQFGPVYRQADVAKLLGKSKQAVSADRGLVKLTMRSGDVGYPVFQFRGRRQLPGVREVVMELTPAVATAWTIASWLTSPHDHLDGSTPMEALHDERAEEVVALARRTARALAS